MGPGRFRTGHYENGHLDPKQEVSKPLHFRDFNRFSSVFSNRLVSKRLGANFSIKTSIFRLRDNLKLTYHWKPMKIYQNRGNSMVSKCLSLLTSRTHFWKWKMEKSKFFKGKLGKIRLAIQCVFSRRSRENSRENSRESSREILEKFFSRILEKFSRDLSRDFSRILENVLEKNFSRDFSRILENSREIFLEEWFHEKLTKNQFY